jgi:prepilin-type N-terminal cleavage/methylation domain-containing protein
MIGAKNKNYNRLRKAFSLIEVIISVALFSIIMLSATEIFKMVVDSQRSALATQNVQESLKYFLEVAGKEMRMAQKNKGICPGISDDEIFVVTTTSAGDVLKFKNYYNQCISYFLTSDGTNKRFSVTRGVSTDYITPNKIAIDNLRFVVASASSTQPTVTMNLRAHALGSTQYKSDMTIQTSITSRYYK